MAKKQLVISIETDSKLGISPKMFGLAMEQIKSTLKEGKTEGYVDITLSIKDPDFPHIPSCYRAFFYFLK